MDEAPSCFGLYPPQKGSLPSHALRYLCPQALTSYSGVLPCWWLVGSHLANLHGCFPLSGRSDLWQGSCQLSATGSCQLLEQQRAGRLGSARARALGMHGRLRSLQPA